MDLNEFKNMYTVEYKIKGDDSPYIQSAYFGGDTEEQAKQNCINQVLSYSEHMKKGYTADDINILEIRYLGDYARELKYLMNS